jgi:hypothetical protein
MCDRPQTKPAQPSRRIVSDRNAFTVLRVQPGQLRRLVVRKLRPEGLDRLLKRHFFALSPSSTRRRMASGRDKSGAFFLIQASNSATPAGGTLTPISVAPTGGRPIRFFLLSDTVDLLMSICYQKGKPRGSSNFRLGSNPSHNGA